MNKHVKIFNNIAFIYQWFFRLQIKSYKEVIRKFDNYLDISCDDIVLDIGCGTGAFAFSLQKRGYNVIGLDASPAMVRLGRENNICCIQGNIAEGIKFPDDSFDLVTASYVAHGLNDSNRIKLYKEARRLSNNQVLFHDYNQNNHFIFSLINIIEYLEGGNYFSFRDNAVSEMEEVFDLVKVINVGMWNNWYLCS